MAVDFLEPLSNDYVGICDDIDLYHAPILRATLDNNPVTFDTLVKLAKKRKQKGIWGDCLEDL